MERYFQAADTRGDKPLLTRLKRILCGLAPTRRDRSLILVYHSVGSWSPAAIPQEAFRDQMDTLRRTYQVVPLATLVAGVSAGQTGLAAVTIDDGYQDCYECAFPILERMAIPFTVFLPTGYLETGQAEWAAEYRALPPLTWRQVREMQQHRAEVGCHTHEHWRWSERPSEVITRDLNTSRRILEDNLGTSVSSFAYPYGQPHDIDGRGASLLPECGFRFAFTTLHTTVTSIPDPFRIPRITVNVEDTASDYLQNLRGQRDILAPLERARSAGIVAARRAMPVSSTVSA